MRRWLLVLLLISIVVGCTGVKRNETKTTVKPVPFLRQAVVMSVNGKYKLLVFFELPTPCHKIRYDGMSISDHDITVYFEYIPPKPGTVCIQMLKKVNETVDLGKLSKGNYTILIKINGSTAKILKFRVS